MALILDFILRLTLWLLLAPMLPGIINKVKAWVAGRRGPPVLQLYYDLARLWRKGVVLSTLASPGLIVGPAVAWVALMGAAMLVPLGTAGAALSFRGDVLLLIYLLALARFCTAWAAMETIKRDTWVKRVCRSFSSGPEKITSMYSRPSRASARSKMALATAKLSKSSFPMPTYWDP